MRLRETYTLYKRKLQSGNVVYYYQVYDDDGNKLCGHSTGKRTKTAARNYCNELLREGRLMPQKREIPTFKKFAEGWWEWDTCPYLKKRKVRREITKSYADNAKSKLHIHVLPYFGKMRLDRISEFEIEAWLTSFAERGYRNSTANSQFDVLVTMLNEAVRQKLIKANPALHVVKLKNNNKVIDILKPEEVKKMFPADWSEVWDSYLPYMINKLAACTGMRFGEVLGVRGEFVHEDYIAVCGQHTKYGYTGTKTHDNRNVPIPSAIRKDLEELRKINGDGYLFSADGGETPLPRPYVYDALFTAMKRIGIGEEERKSRHLSFHGWRHFFNTTLRMANVADSKVMSVTGHKSRGMTDHYTHFDTAQFTEVRQVQEALLLSEPAVMRVVGRSDQVNEIQRVRSGSDVEAEPGNGKDVTAGRTRSAVPLLPVKSTRGRPRKCAQGN